jgi:hypothetical protein
MKIVISSGHSKYCRGMSSTWLDEVDEATRVVDRVGELLRATDVSVVTYHDVISDDQQENLNRICTFHNSQGPHDLDVSLHFNANATTNSPMGTEVWYVTQDDLATKVAGAMAKAGGFKNRGKKYTNNLYFLNGTTAPAVLLEVCFGDSSADCSLYYKNFEAICVAIAESLTGVDIDDVPPVEPPDEQPPARPDNPFDVSLSTRPVISQGDEGPDVEDLQTMLNWEMRPSPDLTTDGDFGSLTRDAVLAYQSSRGLGYDGICGQQTWTALYDHKAPLPPPPHVLTELEIEEICALANESVISNYSWNERGVAPVGYIQGMALAFAQSVRKLEAGHPAALVMASARMSSDKDALNIYRIQFEQLRMSNEEDGIDTLRHLYALMLGSGMRESSGRHCEGRDQSASNTSSDTAEAGLFQTSWNAHSASDPEFTNLMAEYSNSANKPTCYLSQFDDGVTCSSSDWSCYGSGYGYDFQKLCKECPAFAVETHALTLRNLANHYGPIIRQEVELKKDADRMFMAVQRYLDEGPPRAKRTATAKHTRRRA